MTSDFLVLMQMEESIYRMSLGEIFLVLIIIGLWIFAVINLAKKFERICNPPSINPNYLYNKTSLSPSTLHGRYSNDLIPPTRSFRQQSIRATSEPNIDASPRTTIVIRSPSETCLYTRSSISEQIPSASILELRKSNSLLDLPHHNGYRIHVETISDKPPGSQQLLHPRRLPSIVRQSLLDLHRRTLTSNTSTPGCVVTTTENQSVVKIYQRDNTIGEDRY